MDFLISFKEGGRGIPYNNLTDSNISIILQNEQKTMKCNSYIAYDDLKKSQHWFRPCFKSINLGDPPPSQKHRLKI